MTTTKVLPMGYPCITSYPTHANMLACLAQDENSIQWFYNYYIQLFIGTNSKNDRSSFIDFCVPQPWKACPWLDYQKIDRSLVRKGWNSVSEFIIDCIDSDYYVYLYLDQFYIPASWAYQTQHFAHDSFIYGYDRSNKQFSIADFNKYSKYGFSMASFSQTDEAFKDEELLKSSDQLRGIVLVKPIKYDFFNFDIKALRLFIEDYIQSKLSSKSYTDNYRVDMGDSRNWWAYGLDVYSYYKEYLELVMEQNLQPDIRGLQIMVDHKTLMLSRIKYLAEHHFLTNADSIYEEYEAVMQEFVKFRNLAIKIYITGNIQGFQQITSEIMKSAAKEREVLEKLLDNLVG